MLANREYCRQLNPYRTPIGIYEQSDYIYQCVGCCREVSRSTGLFFGFNQTSESYALEDRADL